MKTLLSAVCACVLLVPAAASAKEYSKPFMVEVRGGPSSPSVSIGDLDADLGYSFASLISLNFLNDMLGVYFEYSAEGYEADSLSNINIDGVLLYGFGLGMSHEGRFGPSRLGYFVRLGLHNSQLELIDDDGDDIDKTRFELGFQTSAGVRYNFSKDWSMRAGLQFKTFAQPLKRNNANRDAELDSVTLTVGGAYRF